MPATAERLAKHLLRNKSEGTLDSLIIAGRSFSPVPLGFDFTPPSMSSVIPSSASSAWSSSTTVRTNSFCTVCTVKHVPTSPVGSTGAQHRIPPDSEDYIHAEPGVVSRVWQAYYVMR